MTPGAAAVALATSLATALGGPGAPSPAGAVRGTYRLRGTAHVAAAPALEDEIEVHADAVLRPGKGPRDVRALLMTEGQTCEVGAKLGEGGALSFDEGQRCVLDLRSPTTRGRIEARLRSGSGRIRDGVLALQMEFGLEGAVSMRTASRVEVLGREVDLPATWTPQVPVHGDARATAEGRRDGSRAAQP